MNMHLVVYLSFVAFVIGLLLIISGIKDLIRKRDHKILMIGVIITFFGSLVIWIAASAHTAV
jgi:hypothetical protein